METDRGDASAHPQTGAIVRAVVPVAPRVAVVESIDDTVGATMPSERHFVPWSLTFANGEVVWVGRTGLVVGRSPVAPVRAPHAQPLRIDSAVALSKTHALFDVQLGVLGVTDLGSTNGTYVIDPSGIESTVPAGARIPVVPGGAVELGPLLLRVGTAPGR